MKRSIFFWLLSFYIIPVFAQTGLADSLKLLLQNEKQDTNRVLLLAEIATSYIFEKPEIGLTYVEQGLELARSIKYERGEVKCLNAFGASQQNIWKLYLRHKIPFAGIANL